VVQTRCRCCPQQRRASADDNQARGAPPFPRRAGAGVGSARSACGRATAGWAGLALCGLRLLPKFLSHDSGKTARGFTRLLGKIPLGGRRPTNFVTPHAMPEHPPCTSQ